MHRILSPTKTQTLPSPDNATRSKYNHTDHLAHSNFTLLLVKPKQEWTAPAVVMLAHFTPTRTSTKRVC
ncbi:MAG: hypothetical protein ABI234_09415 [Ktedonobacteraceae bacterium]